MTWASGLRRKDGIAFVPTVVDQAFRKALMDGVPPSLRSKMIEALAATPDARARGHSFRYFGAEFPQVAQFGAELAEALHRYLESRGQPGFLDWLNITNFGNDYRMLKVFFAWSQLKSAEPAKPGLNA